MQESESQQVQMTVTNKNVKNNSSAAIKERFGNKLGSNKIHNSQKVAKQ